MKVFRGVLAFRLIAAAHMAARQTESQVHPARAGRHTLFAARGSTRRDVVDLIEMYAGLRFHRLSLQHECGLYRRAEVRVHERDRHGAFADGRRDALH